MAQAIFLGLHIMWLAEQTSNFVKAPITVALLKNGGVLPEPGERIEQLMERVKLFSKQFDSLFLACPDTGLQPGEFAGKVDEFVKTLIHLRRDYVEEWVGHAVEEGLDKICDPYTLAPAGTTIIIDPSSKQAEELRRVQASLTASIRENFAYTQDAERIIANLEALKIVVTKLHTQQTEGGEGPTEEEYKNAAVAQGELHQAELAGPFKIGQDICNLLTRVRDFMNRDWMFGEPMNLQLRHMAIQQTINYIQRPTEASPSAVQP
jgi:hypothetical protein